MAITFEEKNNSSMTIIIILLGLIILGAAGFLMWQSFIKNTKPVAIAVQPVERIDDKVLKDPTLESLELFPQIPPSATPLGKNNPFLEGDSATSTVQPGGVDGSSSLPVMAE